MVVQGGAPTPSAAASPARGRAESASADDQIRARILDAAYQCLMDSGYSTRLHAAIAERSGYSRPTVYKYLGDQQAIIGALVHRELSRYFAIAQSVLTTPGSPRERFVDAVVFSVQFGRQHPLLQKGLRENPEVVLPWFTVNSGPMINLCLNALTPHIELLVSVGELPARTDARVITEWTFRLAISLVISPSTLELPDADSLRAYLGALLDIGGATRPSAGSTVASGAVVAAGVQPGGATT
ncbi:TetR family transcriptional regulator [Jatrophihabitans sp. GAS493]|uniref:TetR/AcrR family transcriptional regulator n=1 Tax=Jatrophihabitans sp. GAS493 TaxID=1907575 RepID=UPI000BC0E1F4|nr:TetR/AcrR family transcriptional regulator [Jatrophihabitans sp. GAS493]SOD70559.1 TetR family transcriptional regulator [Jatrophihabitans sp. GAS493]